MYMPRYCSKYGKKSLNQQPITNNMSTTTTTTMKRPYRAVMLANPDAYPEALELRECTKEMQDQMIQQIGVRNVMAISGGRWMRIRCGVYLPVGKGYAVIVEVNGSDYYRVHRVFKRGEVLLFRGTMDDVFCEDLPEVAYYASCFVNVQFPLNLEEA